MARHDVSVKVDNPAIVILPNGKAFWVYANHLKDFKISAFDNQDDIVTNDFPLFPREVYEVIVDFKLRCRQINWVDHVPEVYKIIDYIIKNRFAEE